VNRLEIRDNLVPGSYGIMGNDKGVGLRAVDWYCRDYDIRRNAMIGGTSSWYRENEHFREFFFPAHQGAVGFMDPRLRDTAHFRLLETSPYRGAATDGADLGADIRVVLAATTGSASGRGGPAGTTPALPRGLREQ
jgi:hypothetical protein